MKIILDTSYGAHLRSLAFMRIHSMFYYAPTDSVQIQKARPEAALMPCSPAKGCVKDCAGIIVVKLSE